MDEDNLSFGIKYLGLSLLDKYFKYLCDDNYNNPIISVGSGNGVVEKFIKDNNPNIKIICIDPNPNQFIPVKNNEFIKPEFDTIENLLKEQPSIIENCILFLNWPSPNDSTYDIEAVRSLQPSDIITIVDKSGTAGGEEFLEWLNNPNPYHIVAETIRHGKDCLGWSITYSIIWLTKRENVNKNDIPEIIEGEIIFPKDENISNIINMMMLKMLLG
jgi:hypothetical protein